MGMKLVAEKRVGHPHPCKDNPPVPFGTKVWMEVREDHKSCYGFDRMEGILKDAEPIHKYDGVKWCVRAFCPATGGTYNWTVGLGKVWIKEALRSPT